MSKYIKIFLAFIILFLVYVFIPNSIQAHEFVVDGNTYNIQDVDSTIMSLIESTPEYISGEYIYFTRLHDNGGTGLYFFPKSALSNFRYYVDNINARVGGTYAVTYKFINDNYNFNIISYAINNNVLSNSSASSAVNWWTFTVKPNNNITLSTNSNVYYSSSGDTIFFQGAPIVVTQGILAPIMATAPAQRTLAEILGILPIVLVVIVSYLALRKGLAALFRLLHQS